MSDINIGDLVQFVDRYSIIAYSRVGIVLDIIWPQEFGYRTDSAYIVLDEDGLRDYWDCALALGTDK